MIAKPDFIFFKVWKNLFIGNCILVANNKKLFIRIHNPFYEFPKKRKWWIGYNYITLLKNFGTFFTTKISIPIKKSFSFIDTVIFKFIRLFIGVNNTIIKSSDNFLIMEINILAFQNVPEITPFWVIARHINNLIFKMLTIITNFLFNVAYLRIKLIVFSSFSAMKRIILFSHNFSSLSYIILLYHIFLQKSRGKTNRGRKNYSASSSIRAPHLWQYSLSSSEIRLQCEHFQFPTTPLCG